MSCGPIEPSSGGDRAGQMVGGEVEKGEAGQASQFRWDRPSQLVAPGQAQLAQCGQLAQLGGDRTVQSLAIHVQLRHPPHAVQRTDCDPVPGAERGVGAPVEGGRASQGRLEIEQDGTVVEQLGMVCVVGDDRAVLANRRGEGALAAVAQGEVENPGDSRADGQQRSEEAATAPQRQGGQKDDA